MTRIKLKLIKNEHQKKGWHLDKLENKEDKEKYEEATNEKLEHIKEARIKI